MAVIDFTQLDNLIEKGKRLSETAAWIFAVDQDVQDELIRLNTEDQLEEQGINSLGEPLGDYSPTTVIMKILKGDRYDHVTLHDEGDFYDSWIVKVTPNGWTLDADDSSKYDRPLFEVWGIDVLGITEDNLEYIRQMIAENYVRYVYDSLL